MRVRVCLGCTVFLLVKVFGPLCVCKLTKDDVCVCLWGEVCACVCVCLFMGEGMLDP